MDRKGIVTKMAVLYFGSFMCFGGSQLVVGFVYDAIGLYNLGQVNQFLIYIGFFVSTFFAKRMITYFKELKTTIFVGFMMYGFAILGAILTYGCYLGNAKEGICSVQVLRLLNYASNLLLGVAGAPLVWSGQYEMIDRLSNEEDSKEHFAIFYSTLQFNGVTGNLLNIIFYSFKLNTMVCFAVFYIGFNVSVFSFLCLIPSLNGFDMRTDKKGAASQEPVELRQLNQVGEEAGKGTMKDSIMNGASLIAPEDIEKLGDHPTQTWQEEVMSVFKAGMLPKVRQLIPFMIQAGLYQGYLVGAIYRLVAKIYEGTGTEDVFVKKMISYVMITSAVASMSASQVVKRLKGNVRNWAIKISSVLVSVMMVLLYYFYDKIDDVTYVFEMVLIFGASDVCFNQLSSVYMSENYPGKLEAFSVFKQLQNSFTCIFMAIYIWLQPETFRVVNGISHMVLSVWLLISLR